MKNERLGIKIEQDEKELLKRAAMNLTIETGSKKTVSAAVRHAVKKYAEADLTKPELYFINRQAIKEVETNINYGLIWIQKFLNEFKKITGENLNLAELENLFLTQGKLGSTNLIQSAIISMVKQKLFDQLKRKYPGMTPTFDNVPKVDLTELFEIADQVDSMPEVQNKAVIYWHCYSVNGNAISALSEKVEKLKDQFRFFATTPEEITRLQLVKKICRDLNELLSDPDARPNVEKIFSVVYFDRESWQFVPSGAFVKFPLTVQPLFDRPTTGI